MSNKNELRLQSVNLFLTYHNKHSYSFEDVKNHLDSKFSNNLFGYIIAFETSDNDHPYDHLHIYVKLKKRFNIRSPNYLDLPDNHGSYEMVRSVSHTIRYTIKDGDYIASANLDIHKLVSQIYKNPFDKFVYNCKNNILNEHTAKLLIHPQHSKDIETLTDYYKHPKRYQEFLRDFFKTPLLPKDIFIELSIECFERIRTWYKENRKSLFIYGASGIGKTALVFMLFKEKVLFVRHTDALKQLTLHHSVIAFDDMNFKHFSPEALINLVDTQHESQLDVKNSMVYINKGVRKIFTSNLTPEKFFFKDIQDLQSIDNIDSEQINAIMRRIEPLYLRQDIDIVVHKELVPPRRGYVLLTLETILDWD